MTRVLIRSASVCCFVGINALIVAAMVITRPGSPAEKFADEYRTINIAAATIILTAAFWRKRLGWLPLIGLAQLLLFLFVAVPIINRLHG